MQKICPNQVPPKTTVQGRRRWILGLATPKTIVIGLKNDKTRQRVFLSPYTKMIVGSARPFSSAVPALKHKCGDRSGYARLQVSLPVIQVCNVDHLGPQLLPAGSRESTVSAVWGGPRGEEESERAVVGVAHVAVGSVGHVPHQPLHIHHSKVVHMEGCPWSDIERGLLDYLAACVDHIHGASREKRSPD